MEINNFYSLEENRNFLFVFALDSILPVNIQEELRNLSNIANLIIL